MSWYTSGQNDQNIRYWLLDSSHGSYETRRAAIESLSPNYTIDNGSVANTKVVRGYATDAEIASNSLDIGGAVLDRVHNFVNPFAAIVTIETNAWGDKFPLWGKFLKQPRAIPTTPIDRLVQWWKDGVESALYVSQSNRGTGDGSSYANAKSVVGIDTTSADIVVICGTLARKLSETTTGLGIKTGTSGARTQWLAHPVEGAICMGAVKLGSGVGSDGAYVNDGGDRFKITNTSGAGGGAPFGQGFVFYFDGTDYIPLSLVADATAVSSEPLSYYAELSDAENGGSAGSSAWVNLDGATPTVDNVFWGLYAIKGVKPAIAAAEYFDVYGIRFINCAWTGTGGTGAEYFSWYACDFSFWSGPFFGYQDQSVDEVTGAFSYDQPHERLWQGCKFSYAYVCVYDTNLGHIKVPINTYYYDNYVTNLNLHADDAWGVDLFSEADAHSFTTQGCDGWYVDNNAIEQSGGQPIVIYTQPNNFTEPSGGLELTDLYVLGVDYPNTSFEMSDGTWTCPSYAKNVEISYNRIYNMRLTGNYSGADQQPISLNGDSGQVFGNNGAYDDIIIEYNRIEGPFNDGCIRVKYAYPDGNTSYPIIRFNTLRCDGGIAFRAFDGGVNISLAALRYEPSFSFTDNDIQSTNRFVSDNNVLVPDHHVQIFDRNTYRGTGIWSHGSGTDYSTFALWKAAQPTGDTYDPNSTHTALTTDTGSPTLTTTGGPNLNATLSASLGSDPDGATSSLSYQWFRNGALISGATSSTYAATEANGNSAGDDITLVVLGTDAKGKWFLVTSDTVTLEGQGVPTPAPTIVGHGGIPLSEDEFYRKQKKNRPVVENMDVAPQPVPVAVYTGVIERPKPPILRSSPELKASLERAEQIARERPKKRNRRKDDDWFILN